MKEKDENVLDGNRVSGDEFENNIRPQRLDDYIGQTDVKENIRVFVEAAKMRDESLDHVLLYGPPGLGKTTLAHIIANELGVNIKTASGPSIEKGGDLAAILSTLEPGDVLFIDEIHRMPRVVEEILYPAMEDFELDIIIGSEGSTKSIKINLPPFTLVGATTRSGDLSSPLRDRFGIVCKLNYYTNKELSDIVKRTSNIIGIDIAGDAALELARRSRKTPRIANRLYKRVRDFAMVEGLDKVDLEITKKSLERLKVDNYGLDEIDIEYLKSLITKFNGGPVGVETIATSIGEEVTTIEDVVEPFLLQEGFIKRTRSGRIATEKSYEHLGLNHSYSLFDTVSSEEE
ncbi:MAG TPA: Holliday junction branch migration DNA helicase RuvB [Firmicutes bacterium]|nr:Holliday junction branch migration DNA helicase RuvB [Bacillota bacterium]